MKDQEIILCTVDTIFCLTTGITRPGHLSCDTLTAVSDPLHVAISLIRHGLTTPTLMWFELKVTSSGQHHIPVTSQVLVLFVFYSLPSAGFITEGQSMPTLRPD